MTGCGSWVWIGHKRGSLGQTEGPERALASGGTAGLRIHVVDACHDIGLQWDLRALVEQGVIERRGKTNRVEYVLARGAA